MPITLRHERDLQAIAMAKRGAALSQDAVVALSKALHDQQLDDIDRRALERSASLVQALGNDDTGLRPTGTGARLFATNGGLTAFWAARAEGHEKDAVEFFRGLGESLTDYLDGTAALNQTAPHLSMLRDLFLRMGELNLAAVNAATQVQDVGAPWPATPKHSTS
jgi:hypothetical protein